MNTPSVQTTPLTTHDPAKEAMPSATAPSTPQPVAAPADATTAPKDRFAPRPVSFTRLVRVELRKALDTRAGQGLLVAIALLSALSLGLVLWFSREQGAGFGALLGAVAVPQGVLLPVLGILTACSEWSQRTALVTFTQEPRRLRVMAAKSVAAVLIGLGVLALTIAVSAGAHVLSAGLADTPVSVDLGAARLVNLTLLQTANVLLGVAFGALFLNTPAAVVAFFLIPSILPIALTFVPFLREHAPWFDMDVFAVELAGGEWLTRQDWLHLASNLGIWLVLPLVVGLIRVSRKEIG
ncbi:hypothetical protein SAMN05445756_1915 [Kytococcus aerolatus]|uniref:ABC-2 family transporter protein n=1 Tax=Kytococcus aerolatus TaxID=592308 RepID=A0A212U503_9MICO|nr:ABC transporter permease [Kytococcus aerolatus]SNC73338.1 hypothetical protein SAMN05445756_1915 [Kytococcus aerolatus]